jgi:hypothetical protein
MFADGGCQVSVIASSVIVKFCNTGACAIFAAGSIARKFENAAR